MGVPNVTQRIEDRIIKPNLIEQFRRIVKEKNLTEQSLTDGI